jgi:hypothetical protein
MRKRPGFAKRHRSIGVPGRRNRICVCQPVLPEFDRDGHFVCAVDGRNSGYLHSSIKPYQPSRLVPKLGLTFGITLRNSDASQRDSSPEWAALWHALGPESESGNADGLTAFRWDLDDCGVDDPRICAQTMTLRAIKRWLEDRKIPYRAVLFDIGSPEVSGELPAIDDVFTGPANCLTLSWQARTGEPNSVTANDAEFMVDGDDVPDSELWAL